MKEAEELNTPTELYFAQPLEVIFIYIIFLHFYLNYLNTFYF